MTLLKDAIQEKKLDVRMIEKNLQKGVVSNDELNRSLSDLPDDADDAEYVSIESIAADPSLK
jgi:hypothetical protein